MRERKKAGSRESASIRKRKFKEAITQNVRGKDFLRYMTHAKNRGFLAKFMNETRTNKTFFSFLHRFFCNCFLPNLTRYSNVSPFSPFSVTLHDIVHTEKSLTLVFEYLEKDLKQYMDDCGGILAMNNVKVRPCPVSRFRIKRRKARGERISWISIPLFK